MLFWFLRIAFKNLIQSKYVTIKLFKDVLPFLDEREDVPFLDERVINKLNQQPYQKFVILLSLMLRLML